MNIQERRNKDGKITSYRIRMFDHRDTQTGRQVFRTLSVKYDPDKSEAWNRKNAEKQDITCSSIRCLQWHSKKT